MPELPEVETILNSLKPHLEGATIQDVIVRQPQLRWLIPSDLKDHLMQRRIGALYRRAKYLLMPVATGTVLFHLGMSGSLRIVARTVLPARHDHVDIIFSATHLLRYTDPRRFGTLLWVEEAPYKHPLLEKLGPEPLAIHFSAGYLYQSLKNRKAAIKTCIMHSHIVVGVGNIYAAEALFLANIHPLRPAGSLTKAECGTLVQAIQHILRRAIKQGGTTVKDFINSDSKPGYFAQELQVYGRAGLPCVVCRTPLQSIKLTQRSTVFCIRCQQ